MTDGMRQQTHTSSAEARSCFQNCAHRKLFAPRATRFCKQQTEQESWHAHHARLFVWTPLVNRVQTLKGDGNKVGASVAPRMLLWIPVLKPPNGCHSESGRRPREGPAVCFAHAACPTPAPSKAKGVEESLPRTPVYLIPQLRAE